MIIRVIVMVALPVAVFFCGAAIMEKVSGHQEAVERASSAPDPRDRQPLGQRFGYDSAAVDGYWGALDGAREAERRFLEVDLLFPFLYGGALAASLLLAWSTLGRPFNPVWILAPVALTLLSDWTENLVQLAQLRRYADDGGGAALQPGWIRLASTATSLKLLAFGASSLLLLTLVAMVLRSARHS